MAEQYTINGKWLKSLFGITVYKDSGVRESSDSFMAWPDRKESLTVERQDEDGLQVDLASPKFASREFVLKCALNANNRADYFNKYNGFRTEVFAADTHELYVADQDQLYYVYYKKQANFKTLSNINNDGVWATFDVIFGERNPSENMQSVYLVDDQDRFLIA